MRVSSLNEHRPHFLAQEADDDMPLVRFSDAFIPTLREAPAEAATASHRLLLRAGFIRQLGAGIYSYLPLAVRSLRRVEQIIREEMEAIGAQEFLLPALHPADVWKESGRWDEVDETMFRLKDRKGGDYALGMTHEEVFTAIARNELRSYRQLPQTWYQIQTKFRDEPRPRGGLLRVREFAMKDSYSFDADRAGLDKAFDAHKEAYQRIFARCGLDAIPVQAFSGVMGGKESSEFVVRAAAGEDLMAHCAACGYAANLEVAKSQTAAVADETPDAAVEPFATPGVTTIDDLARAPYSVGADRQLKSLVYMADNAPVLAVIRGDDELNEAKLQSATGAVALRPASADEIVPVMGARPGSLGPVGFKGRTFIDATLAARANMVTGANRDGYHVRGVNVARDVTAAGAQSVDLRTVRGGEGCPTCGAALEVFPTLEVGHIFKLGTRYSERLGAMITQADGTQTPVVMGSYGIGVGRVLAAVVEQRHDDAGIRWPLAVAPFHVTVLTLGDTPEVMAAADQVVGLLEAAGLDVLYDDRKERPGVKFKDADLVGVPIRIGVGPRALASGRSVEWKRRDVAGDVELVPIADVAAKAAALVAP
jgi:prolyl-tRNA synthetase